MGMTTLAPGLLVAAPPMSDPRFERSVVLLAAHGAEGAFGWVINGRELMSFSELLLQAEMAAEPDADGLGRVRLGGPVGPERVWLLYPERDRYEAVEEQIEVGPDIIACSSKRVLAEIAGGRAPTSLLAVAGYAGWGPSQLEDEIRGGSWLPLDADSNLLFDSTERDANDVWLRAYENIGASAMAFTSRVVGSA